MTRNRRTTALAAMMLGAGAAYGNRGGPASAATGRRETKPTPRSRMAKASRKKNRPRKRSGKQRSHAR